MSGFFSNNPGKLKMEIFGFWHATAVVFCLLAFWLTHVYRKKLKGLEKKKKIRVAVVAFFIGLDILFHTWKVINGIETVLLALLTISLCRFSLYLSFVVFIGENKKLFKLLYFCSIGGILTMIYPSTMFLGPDRFRYYHYFLNHIFFMWVCSYCISVKGYRIEFRDFVRAMKFCLAAVGMVLIIDLIFDKNFMYLVRLPVDIEWARGINVFPLYTIIFVTAIMTMCFLMYLPWMPSEIAARNREKSERRA